MTNHSNLFSHRKPAWLRAWERDSRNGGMPTFKEMGADLTGKLTRENNPGGRFEGYEYDWINLRRGKKIDGGAGGDA